MSQVFSPLILLHMLTAFAALGLGGLVFLRRKGTASHGWTGRAWVLLMLLTAISSFWITGSDGLYSWIHGLSVLVIVLLALGVRLAIAGRIRGHRMTMTGVYLGGLIVAGGFTLLPYRLLGQMLWSSLGLI
jgi:uncharacterized membrane protein